MIFITEEAINSDELLRLVLDEAHGAQALFIGVIRNNNEGRRVEALTYDGFKPLVEKTLFQIAGEASAQWGVRVAAAQRLGRLSVGEASVAIAVGAAHRQEAFASCRYVIDEIKHRLPVWKKEHYAGGESVWIAGHSLQQAA